MTLEAINVPIGRPFVCTNPELRTRPDGELNIVFSRSSAVLVFRVIPEPRDADPDTVRYTRLSIRGRKAAGAKVNQVVVRAAGRSYPSEATVNTIAERADGEATEYSFCIREAEAGFVADPVNVLVRLDLGADEDEFTFLSMALERARVG